jgi:hypothetical protein
LQHSLLVSLNNIRRLQLIGESTQTVIAIDHASIEIIEITGREASSVEGYQRS